MRDWKSLYIYWSDDNLSTDYFWRFLSPRQHELIASYRNYGRVCCFKGFDEQSFVFNTGAAPELWNQQFDLMKRFVDLGIDLYAYITLTTPSNDGIETQMRRFLDKLQDVHPLLPLRTVPLEVKMFSPIKARLGDIGAPSPFVDAIKFQWEAIECWQQEIESRFDRATRALPITEIRFH